MSNLTNLIPNAENAVVDIRNLRDYCLNPQHDQGKHKARLFLSSLGMTADNAEELRQIVPLYERLQLSIKYKFLYYLLKVILFSPSL